MHIFLCKVKHCIYNRIFASFPDKISHYRVLYKVTFQGQTRTYFLKNVLLHLQHFPPLSIKKHLIFIFICAYLLRTSISTICKIYVIYFLFCLLYMDIQALVLLCSLFVFFGTIVSF